jgi:hypothetical protein
MRPKYLLLTALTLATCAPAPAAEPSRYTDGKHGPAELKHVEGVPVLILQGTPEQMGEQTVALTREPLRRVLDFPREALKHHKIGLTLPVLVALAHALEPQIPADQHREMGALAKALGADRDTVLFGNTFPDISKTAGCSSLVVNGERSNTGGPLFGRNLDYPSLGFLHEYSLMVVRRTQGKKAFVSVGFPGLVGCLSGLNEDGLALAVHEIRASRDGAPRLDPRGVPYTTAFRLVLEECSTIKEAEALLHRLPRTTPIDLVLCDKGGGAVFEITSKNLAVRKGADGLTPCTNHFLTPELGVETTCRRLQQLERRRELKTLGLKEVVAALHDANQGEATIQTMVFEPAALKVHLALGRGPTSARPLKPIDLKPLFKK